MDLPPSLEPAPVSPLPADVVAALSATVDDGMPRGLVDLASLVAHRSVADPEVEPESECRAAAEHVADLVRDLGLDVELVAAPNGALMVHGRAAGPEGTPTVLLYSHYDVQPAGDLDEWDSDPWVLTERDGRWFGRGSADCKGNLVATLVALRAVTATHGAWPCSIIVVSEGSEEQSTAGIEHLLPDRPELVGADVMVVADAGNVALGVPTVTTTLRGTGSVTVTVRTLAGPAHSGMYGGAAPDALAALIATLSTLRDESGDTVIDGLDNTAAWDGNPYAVEDFRADARVLDGVDVLTGTHGGVGEMLWARANATVLAIDAPSVSGATAAIQPTARALVGLRVPAGMDAVHAQRALAEHLQAHTPWGAQVEVHPVSSSQPFRARTDGPAYAALALAMEAAYGRPMVTTGQGGSIPLTHTLTSLHPDAELLLIGVEEPGCRIHAPNESVHPDELRRTALALALLLTLLGDRSGAAGS
jgi:acetylornithine deacetylase/succinyl-diaminopimelate desuccinylase-like protein